MFIDTHCHLFSEYYDDLDSIIEKIQNSNISHVINNGCDNNSNREVVELVGKYPFMYGAIGIHPEATNTYNEKDFVFIEENLFNRKIVAIGEIGLDYHYGKENKEEQILLFERQLALAEKYNFPVIVHSRDATEDTIACLKKYKVRGVIHSFSGSYETACIYMKMGFILGINGVITFKNCNLKEVIKKIGVENIVLETDSPYLTPVPYRGERNDSSHILDIASFVSTLKEISMEELSKITNKTVMRIFDI